MRKYFVFILRSCSQGRCWNIEIFSWVLPLSYHFRYWAKQPCSGADRNFDSGGASHLHRHSSVVSYIEQRSFRCRRSISGLLQQEMTSNIFYQLATYSWNWYKVPAKNLRKFVSGRNGLFGLILAAPLQRCHTFFHNGIGYCLFDNLCTTSGRLSIKLTIVSTTLKLYSKTMHDLPLCCWWRIPRCHSHVKPGTAQRLAPIAFLSYSVRL